MKINYDIVRLSKAARVYNVSIDSIVGFLATKGITIIRGPNTILNEEMNIFLQAEYKGISMYNVSLINLKEPDPLVQIFQHGFCVRDKIDIWKYITVNAKQKINFSFLTNKFDKLNINYLDIVIFKIIKGFAKNISINIIVEEIINTVKDLDIQLEKDELHSFIADKDKVLANEIYMTKVTTIMVVEGYRSLDIVYTLRPFLSNETIDFINGVGSGRRRRKILY